MTIFFTDYSGILNPTCYDTTRGNILLVVCHDTSGPGDRNPGNQVVSEAAARYLCSNDREVSAHWYIGAEGVGAPTYRIVPEGDTAYHCGGTPPDYPSHWTDPDTGVNWSKYKLNQVAIGIERFGYSGEPIGPAQLKSLKALVQDIATRNPKLKDPKRWVSHQSLEGDRTDGQWYNLARQWVQELNNNSTGGGTVDPSNPQGFSIGSGFLATLHQRGDVALTNEQYYEPSAGQTGLKKRSFLWARAQDGSTVNYIYYEGEDVKVYREL